MFNRIPLMEDFQGKIKKYILSSWVKIKKTNNPRNYANSEYTC